MRFSLSETFCRWRRALITRRQLRSLSAAQLADIGLQRGQIDAVASGLISRSGEVVVLARPGCAWSLPRLFQAFQPRSFF